MTNKKIARTPKSTKRAAAKPVDSEIQRAARRAGLEPVKGIEMHLMNRGETADHLCEEFGTKLVRATDLAAERVLIARENDTADAGELFELLQLLWEIRWEIGLLPMDVRVDPKRLRRMAIRLEAASCAQPEQAAGGAP
jgi:hypothetical protein